MNLAFSFTQIVSAFVVLFALIDILGSVPLFLSFQKDNRSIKPMQAASYSFAIMIIFLFVGDVILRLFNVDVSSFAVAGSLVIFIISIEMIFGVEIFRNDSPGGKSTLVPIVFPLIAGPGVFTALLSMRAEYQVENIIVALFFNMVFAYFVLKYLDVVRRLIGAEGVYVMRKFFGIILMAISVKLFTVNISSLM
ncbi:MAG: MarC family protein [Dysgonamonadaceae bacterium]